MIKLKGQIHIPKIRGTIYRVAGEGSGGPLQAKTVYPSHTEQIIAPDEDYYGLVSVTVKPVPRLPFAAVSVEAPSWVEYYYNHEELPEIPADVVEKHPYIVIFHDFSTTFRLFGTKTKPYCRTQEDGTFGLYFPGEHVRYNYNVDADAWIINTMGQNSFYKMHGAGWWAVWWANFDIPNGSPDATEIYIPAMGAETEAPAEPTEHYYNGVKLPRIPDDVLAQYPYAWIRLNSDGTTYDLILSPYTWYCSGNLLTKNSTYVWYTATIEASEWVYKTTYTDNGGFNLGGGLLWSNHDIPNGSADATDIFYYGTLAVPAD